MADSHVPQLGADGRIIEGLITTLNKDGTVNISPMGPIVDKNFHRFVLRPYQSSTTYQNLKRGGQAVLNYITVEEWESFTTTCAWTCGVVL